jgi:hypothetical protein
MIEKAPGTRLVRRLALLAGLVLPILLGAAGGLVRVEDFGNYWCGAKINLAGGNPYDHDQVLTLEQTIEPERLTPQMPWGPPWALAVVTPLTVFDFATARWIWLIAETLLFMVAAFTLWSIYDGPKANRLDAVFLCFAYYPTLVMLGLGQISVANLLALAGFLHFQVRGANFAAGMAASLIAVKPQVMVLFALALLAWIVWRRCWNVLAGGAIGMLILSAIVLTPNPRVFAHYVDAMVHRGPTDFVPPTPGTLLRFLAGDAFWPSLIPLAIGIIWLAAQIVYRWRAWQWTRIMPGLAFACFLSSPYAWAYDLVILLVPLTRAAALASAGGLPVRFRFFLSHLFITAAALTMNLLNRQEHEFMWLAPALLVFYIWNVRSARPSLNE